MATKGDWFAGATEDTKSKVHTVALNSVVFACNYAHLPVDFKSSLDDL